MFQRSYTLVPLSRACCGRLFRPVGIQSRNIWDIMRVPDTRSIIRDMNREMERMERNMFRNFPFSFSVPRLIAIDGDTSPQRSYRMNVDVEGFNPEDIKISLKDNVMKIEGQMNKTADDGTSKLQQSFVREFTLPDNVDRSTLKSFIDRSGVLYIEAALTKEEAPQDIPIQIDSANDAKSKK